MEWMPLTSGPHQGKSLPEVFFEDAGYVVGALERGEFQGALLDQAREVCRLASRVLVPLDEDDEDDVVVFYFLLPDGRYSRHAVVGRSDPMLPEYDRHSRARTENRFDLLMPMRIAPADPDAPMSVVRVLKFIVLGNPNVRLTRRQCEGFFDDPMNFVEG